MAQQVQSGRKEKGRGVAHMDTPANVHMLKARRLVESSALAECASRPAFAGQQSPSCYCAMNGGTSILGIAIVSPCWILPLLW